MIKGFSVTQVLSASGITLSPSSVWNDAGTTFTGIKFDVTDTASAAGSLLMDLQLGGSSKFKIDKTGTVSANAYSFNANSNTFFGTDGSQVYLSEAGFGGPTVALNRGGVVVGSSRVFGWGNSGNPTGGVVDLQLFRDAADTLAQRRGTNAQTLRVYNTFTDASNYERAYIGYSSNVLEIGHQAAGTGTIGRQVFIRSGAGGTTRLGGDSSSRVWFTPSNLNAWEMTSSGHFFCGVDNNYDIGSAATGRPRNLFLGSYAQLFEMTAPAAPAANSVRIYAEDDGAGKTRLMALFATGAAQQIAIEP